MSQSLLAVDPKVQNITLQLADFAEKEVLQVFVLRSCPVFGIMASLLFELFPNSKLGLFDAMKSVHSHYDNLKVSREAPSEVIKAAYKALMQRYHPDKNQSSNATEIAKIIQQSYEVLSDPVLRAAHDRWIKEQEAKLNNNPGGLASTHIPPTKRIARAASTAAPVRKNTRGPIGSLLIAFFCRGDVLLFCFVGGLLLWAEFDRHNKPVDTSPAIPIKEVPKATAAPPLICDEFIPVHGYEEWSTKRGRLAPLKIKTSTGKNYWLKLIDIKSNRELGLLYVKGGFPFETKVPLGSLELRYAFGDDWCSASKPFGVTTQYSKADSVFEFTQTGSGYTGYEVELILQQGGNLQTKNISESEF